MNKNVNLNKITTEFKWLKKKKKIDLQVAQTRNFH